MNFGNLVNFFLKETLAGNPNLTKRIQYWLVLKAALNTAKNSWEAAKFLAGHGLWKCYRHPGAGIYLQIGKSNPDHPLPEGLEPGGYPGCYWQNTTTTLPEQTDSSAQIAGFVMNDIRRLAQESCSQCPGCNMPSLWFNMISTELGLDPEKQPNLVSEYLRLRKIFVGF